MSVFTLRGCGRDNADLCTSIYEKSETRGVISNVKEATEKMARCACRHLEHGSIISGRSLRNVGDTSRWRF